MTWSASPNDSPDALLCDLHRQGKNGAFEKEAIRNKVKYHAIGQVHLKSTGYKKEQRLSLYLDLPQKSFNGEKIYKKQIYYFKLAMMAGDSKIVLDTIASASAHGGWLHTKR